MTVLKRVAAMYAAAGFLMMSFLLVEGYITNILIGGIGLGFIVSVAFYNFEPSAKSWGALKSLAIKMTHCLAMFGIAYGALWGTYLSYGGLVDDDLSMASRALAVLMIGFGWLAGNIISGRGQFSYSHHQSAT